jgi:hypothetical protein
MDRFKDTYHRETQADSSIRIKLTFAVNNTQALRRVKGGEKHCRAAIDLLSKFKAGETFTPAQRNYADKLYEKTMEGFALESVRTHVDKKRTGLRFG